jgi:hypothetical protein
MDDNKYNDNERAFSKTVLAGRRKYYFDVRETKYSDYYITITESKKKFENNNFVKQKIFLYKEDFNKFADALMETINFVKQELLPEYDFDEFSHKQPNEGNSYTLDNDDYEDF